MTKVKGGDLMLFIGGKSVAFATNHTLNVNAELADTSNKDEGGGSWGAQEAKSLSWEISTENLYCVSGAGNTYADLFDAMIAMQPIEVVFAVKNESGTNVPTSGWTPKSGDGFKGKATINSLQLSAQNGEYASYTCSLTGVGALTHTNASSSSISNVDGDGDMGA